MSLSKTITRVEYSFKDGVEVDCATAHFTDGTYVTCRDGTEIFEQIHARVLQQLREQREKQHGTDND